MGFFDYYKPVPELKCPICDTVLDDWQGKDGTCGLFVWQQGIAYAVDQTAGDSNIDEAGRKKFRLPEEFEIYTDCRNCSINVIANCQTEREIWSKAQIVKTEKIRKLPRKWLNPK